MPSDPPSTPHLFDRELYLARRKKARGEADDLLTERMAEEAADRFSLIARQFECVLLIADRAKSVREVIGVHDVREPSGDDLKLLTAHYDAVISLLDLQTVNDVPGYLAQIARSLKPDGLFLAALFGEDTLSELRDCWLEAESELTGRASPRVAPMIGTRELGSLLQRAKLALPVTDCDRHTLRYASAFELMQEVKALGLANPMIERSKRLTSRHMLARVAEIYARRFADPDGRVRATVSILWAQAWKPHPGQQQPLKPGSAKARLADALKVREEKL
jgi:SAM-dependent methyltransferase